MRWDRVAALVAVAALTGCGVMNSLYGVGGGNVGSVGAVFGRDRETRALVVREVPEGTAAGQAGLEAGDQVVMIDGFYVKDMDSAAVRTKLRGDIGSKVRLTVLRGNDVLHVSIVRAPVGERHAAPPREERISE